MYSIYVLRLIDSDVPKYVGITSGDLNKRLTKHIHDIKRESCKNKLKKNWLSKYKDSVIIEQIDVADSIDEMKEKEIFYIKYYRSIGVDLLNLTDGGDGTYGYKHDANTIKNMSGEKNHRYGIPNLTNKEKFGKKVESSLDGINWIIHKSIRECSLSTGINFRKIKNICEGNYIFNSSGYFFRFFNDILYKPKNRKIPDQSIRKKPIECFIDNKWVRYESCRDAAKFLNLHREKIVSVCTGSRKTTGGLFFRYIEENKIIKL